MSRYRTLAIGTALGTKSSRATELHAFLEQQGVKSQVVSDPAAKISESWDIVFFLSLEAKPAPALQKWIDRIKAKQVRGRFIVLYNQEISDVWRAALDPEIEIGDDHDLPESLAYLFEEQQHLSEAVESTSHELSVVVEDEALFASDDADANTSAGVEQVTDVWDGGADVQSDDAEVQVEAFDAVALEGSSFDAFESGDPIAGRDDAVDLGDIFANLDDEAEVQHPDSNISEPLAGRDTFSSDLGVDSIFSEELNRSTQVGHSSVSLQLPAMSEVDEPSAAFESEALAAGPSLAKSSDISTLQKYAALKEREAREKEATIQVLKGQLAKIDTKLSRSDAERRRLTLESEEAKNQIGTLEENLSQKKFHIQKMEGHHQEDQRGLSLRLDNALFQASKSQNKLEEFRERVRTDFVKIRAQERELFNKLELQKRDAEALLASKDEQLLSQKREIDRLQYEVETLRERMVEETEKAEERSSRLQRAVQSLKLANDMLSGLSEEVLPAAGDNFSTRDEDNEDAA